jgi:hypothetical protein
MSKYEIALETLTIYNRNSKGVRLLNELVERATPKKALYIHKNLDDLSPTTTWQCPICGKSGYTEMKFTPCCGQALDWSDTNE